MQVCLTSILLLGFLSTSWVAADTTKEVIAKLEEVITFLRRCSCGYSSYDDSCYKFFAANVDWHTAQNRCLADGGNLVDVTSSGEQSFVRSLIDGYKGNTDSMVVWLGGTDLKHEGVFRWVATGNEFTYTNWRKGEPNNLNSVEDCVHDLRQPRDPDWNDMGCSALGNYICKK